MGKSRTVKAIKTEPNPNTPTIPSYVALSSGGDTVIKALDKLRIILNYANVPIGVGSGSPQNDVESIVEVTSTDSTGTTFFLFLLLIFINIVFPYMFAHIL